MRIVAFITEPRVIHKILPHLAAKMAAQGGPPLSLAGQGSGLCVPHHAAPSLPTFR